MRSTYAPRNTLRIAAVSGAALVALALPAGASAASDPADISGTVGSEMSVSAPNATLSAFSPTTDGTGSSAVTVTSTQESWNLTVEDAGSTTPGQLDRVDCGTRAPVADAPSLGSALAFSGPDNAGPISASPTSVRTGGASNEVVTLNLTQGIGATEDLVAGQCYQLQATLTTT